MNIKFHPHALQRMIERGAIEEEVLQTVNEGEKFPVKFGRVGFRRNFVFNNTWRNKRYPMKQVEVYGVEESGELLVITVLVKYF